MKYLILAYGGEKDWNVLSKAEQDKLLAQDAVLRERGDLVAAVQPAVVTVRSGSGTPATSDSAFVDLKLPLAGFGILEAANLDEAIQLVANTPCARAQGAVEIREITAMNDWRTGD